MIKVVQSKIKLIVVITLVFTMCLLAAGCGSSSSDTTVVEGNMITVTDDLGNEMEVKENPDYIGALFAGTTHLIAGLGEVETVVAISQGNTRDYLFVELFPEVNDMRVVKGSSSINFEELVTSPVPEIIFINPEGTVDDSTAEKINSLGIPIYTVSFGTFEEQIESAEKIAAITGTEEEVKAYTEFYEEAIELVEERIATVPEDERKTVYHSINELLRTDKEGTISGEVIETAGGINIADEILYGEETTLTSKSYIAVEELMQANPEYIFINGSDVLDYIESNSQFHSLQAYQNDNIYLLPLGVSRWGHPNAIETPLALYFVAKTLYPELFEDINIEEKIYEFYEEFFGVQLTDEQIDNIIGGRVYKDIKGSGA